MSEPIRDFTTLQKSRRIQLKPALAKQLGWNEGDQLLIEDYKGRLIIENLTKGLIPIKKRIEASP